MSACVADDGPDASHTEVREKRFTAIIKLQLSEVPTCRRQPLRWPEAPRSRQSTMTRSIASLVLLLVAVPLHARNVTILVFGAARGVRSARRGTSLSISLPSTRYLRRSSPARSAARGPASGPPSRKPSTLRRPSCSPTSPSTICGTLPAATTLRTSGTSRAARAQRPTTRRFNA